MLTNKIENIRASGVIPYNITHHMPIFSISDFKILSISDFDTKHKFLCVNDKTIHGFKNDFELIKFFPILGTIENGSPVRLLFHIKCPTKKPRPVPPKGLQV